MSDHYGPGFRYDEEEAAEERRLRDMPNEDELEEALLAAVRSVEPGLFAALQEWYLRAKLNTIASPEDHVKALIEACDAARTPNTLTWRSEKPDSDGWWLFCFPSAEGPCIESSFWNEHYLELEQIHPAYTQDGVWAKIEPPKL